MSALRSGPAPKTTVETSWLNKSLDDRVQILRRLSPEKADAIETIVDDALRVEWEKIGPTPKQARDGVGR